MRSAIALAIAIGAAAGIGAHHAYGFGFLGNGRDFSRLGAIPSGKKAAPVTACGAVGLDFTDPCGTTQKMVLLK